MFMNNNNIRCLYDDISIPFSQTPVILQSMKRRTNIKRTKSIIEKCSEVTTE